jgi:hypothetical protein
MEDLNLTIKGPNMTYSAQTLSTSLSPLMDKIITHPLYDSLSTLSDLCLFMEQHVFAVWDFMCLLKELHRNIVITSSPWLPPKDALSAHLIGSILAEEEGDLTEDGKHYKSHYEIYIDAMKRIGANTSSIEQLHSNLKIGFGIDESLNMSLVPQGTKQFVLTTFSFFNMKLHEIGAAFVYGREGITANIFSPILRKIEKTTNGTPSKLDTLIHYLKRHIELDSNEHFPKALQMMDNLIGHDEQKFQEAQEVAIQALSARIHFLDDIYRLLLATRPVIDTKNIAECV